MLETTLGPFFGGVPFRAASLAKANGAAACFTSDHSQSTLIFKRIDEEYSRSHTKPNVYSHFDCFMFSTCFNSFQKHTCHLG